MELLVRRRVSERSRPDQLVRQLKSTGSDCAMLDRMKKPELLITRRCQYEEFAEHVLISYSILVQSMVSAETMNVS